MTAAPGRFWKALVWPEPMIKADAPRHFDTFYMST
jgi:hypothetical protein